MTAADYDACWLFVAGFTDDLAMPPPGDLPMGGIVGKVTILDCVRRHDSPWFTGPVGWILSDPSPCDLRPCRGRLGLWSING